MPKRLIPILSLVVVWLDLSQSGVLARENLIPTSPKAHLQRADVVFAGRVIRANQDARRIHDIIFDWRLPFIHLAADFDRYRSTFEVTKVWKGDVTASTSVIHQISDSCFSGGYPFLQGEEYIVYARQSHGELYAGGWSRTNLLSATGEDLLALGASKLPKPNPPSSVDILRKLAILSLFFALLGWVAWELRRKYGVQNS